MKFLEFCNDFLLGPSLPLLLLLAGVTLSARLSLFPFRRGKGLPPKSKGEGGRQSPLRATSMALAGTLGVGNISGVALALVGGGAGAVFWMWVSALFAAVLKYGEITLALRYRKRGEKGYLGGAMYYMRDGIGGRAGRRLATVFALLCLFASLSFGSLVQANAVAESFADSLGIPPLVTGALLCILAAAAVFGGAARISALTVRLVPLMSALYLFMTLGVILCNLRGIPAVLLEIFKGAFQFESAAGGVLGYGFARAIRYGTTRGVFSNEAGCGTAPMAHATAENDLPARQGLYGILEVFLDTGVLCTLTALAILLTLGVPSGSLGVAITAKALATVFGKGAGVLLSLAVFCFAYATVICWAFYGESSLRFLVGDRPALRGFSLLFCASLILGATLRAGVIWELADFTVSLMTLLNCFCLLYLWRQIRQESARAGLLKTKKTPSE